jgi:hypothetical protein
MLAPWHYYPKKKKKRGDLSSDFGSSSMIVASVKTTAMFVPLGSRTRRTSYRS